MDIVRCMEEKFLLVMQEALEFLDQGTDYVSFEKRLKGLLDGFGADIISALLMELDEQYHLDKSKRPDWQVVRNQDQKSIVTPFGLVSFNRTYYRHKQTRSYCYLVDERVGFTPHMRVEPVLKADLLSMSTEVSYERATRQLSRYNQELKFSRQTVANTVKEFKLNQPEQIEKRKVKKLYIEADEDHVAGRKRRNRFEVRLIYVHEGTQEHSGRRQLKHTRYFTGVNKTPEELWTEVASYIDTAYETEALENIYLSADGGAWIKSGREWIPGAVFILDRFHLGKYIVTATAHVPQLRSQIYKSIEADDKQATVATLKQALAEAQGEARRDRISRSIGYIENNWDGVQAYYKYADVIGCSAEGHVSHILSSRMSSRPMGWSKNGAENMSMMLASKANGEEIENHYLTSKKPSQLIELKECVQKQIKDLKALRFSGKTYVGNIPLTQSVHSLTRDALVGLKSIMTH